MAKLITDSGRKAIKKIVQISQCARALYLMPTAEDFALRLIGDMKLISKRVNSISTRINEVLDRYSFIPSEFLLKDFDEILEKNNINDYSKSAIKETTDVMSSNTKSVKEMTDALGSAVSTTTSATLQIGGGLSYGTVAMSSNITLAVTGNGRRTMVEEVAQDVIDGKVDVKVTNSEYKNRIRNEVGDMEDVADSIKDWTETSTNNSVEGGGINDAVEWNDRRNEGADRNVENAKREVDEKIQRVRGTFNKLNKDFDEAFGSVIGKDYVEGYLTNTSNEDANFVKNFSIGKAITSLGGIVVDASAATLVMDLLPSIDVDRMMKDIIGGIDTQRIDKMTELQYNEYFEGEPDLLEVPDVPWRLSKDDLEKYNADGYNKYLEEFTEVNDNARSEILRKMQKAKTYSDIIVISKENKEEMKENRSALKAMRGVRRDAIKAKQIEKYKGFLNIELNYLKKDCLNKKTTIKNDWDMMMVQYKTTIAEIKKFFTVEGYGGCETVDRCCDRINDDATQIVELCKSITVELTNAVAMVPTPYAVGICVDMPVHKILAFFKDLKIIITFLKNLIRLGIDIISQLTILAKLIFNGVQSLAEIMKLLKDIIGVDTILNMIEFLIALFKPKMVEAKILIENAISPIYYNETQEYEDKVNKLEAILDEGVNGYVYVDLFRYSDDPNARKKHKKIFGGRTNDEEEVEEWLEELEAKGDREIVAYRSPILNDTGDDFAGWIFYYADAYDDMKRSWSSGKKRRRNKIIKKASKKNKMRGSKLVGGVADLKRNKSFGYYKNGKYKKNIVDGFSAYYWYTKWTSDPTDCDPDFGNVEIVYDKDGNIVSQSAKDSSVVSPIQTTANGSLVELADGSRVFVEGKIVKSGDFVNVNGVKYRVK